MASKATTPADGLDYPGGSDLGLEDKAGAQFSLVWGRDAAGELNAEIAVKDGFSDGFSGWQAVNLDLDQLRQIAAHILIKAALAEQNMRAPQSFRDAARAELRRMLDASVIAETENPADPESWGGDPREHRYLGGL